MHSRLAAPRRAAIALLLAATIVPAFAAAPVSATTYSGFHADFTSMSLMRLTNLDRHALGRRRLKVDQYLVSLARDLPFTCPSNGNTYRGRARDMAARDYLSHAIKGCKTSSGGAYTVQNLLRRVGYSTYTGENIGNNNWPDTGATYRYGCSIYGTRCKGSTTSTAPVATVEKMWMRSSGHRANILNTSYDRFGCAAWNASDGNKYFSCIFAKGGPKKLDTAYPTVGGLSDNSATARKGTTLTFQASFADGFRLSDGWVKVDGQGRGSWAYDLDVTSAGQTLNVDPTKLAAGTHTVEWTVRDVAGHVTRRTVTFEVNR
ncbi:MAG TPA: CAP domain-containing protein [Candidatus Limnocylindrales bacterium]|nr:CAP domain-containing protein [Candidatus Limnocylindrales bacterium]